MPKVIFIEAGGAIHEIDVPIGESLMHAAVKNSVPGIEAECGGACACATCHVYVDEPERLASPGDVETDMLDLVAAERKGGSRLSCQITMRAEFAGLTVLIPETQH